METYLEVNNEQDSIWIGYDERYHDYLVEAFRKVDGGVKPTVYTQVCRILLYS